MQRAWLVVLAVSMAGCPWGDDDSGDGRPHTVDELPGAYHSAACGYLVRCGQFPDRATCMSANLPRISDGFTFDLDPVLVAAIKAGRVQIDQARVDACLATLTGLSCDRTTRGRRELYRQCWHYLVGTLPGGATCFANEECVSAQCSGGSTTDTCVAGTCVGDTPPSNEPAAIGMPCRFDPGCVDGAFCDFNGTSTCTALLQAGEACVGGNDCVYGLECVGNIVGNRFCERLPRLGELCPDFICRDEGTYCADSGRCEAIGLEGDACTGDFEECADAYRCDASSGTCTRAPAAGEPCATTSIGCFDAGFVCDATTALCIEPRPDGGLCTVDQVCASRHCDTAAQQCRAVPMCF